MSTTGGRSASAAPQSHLQSALQSNDELLWDVVAFVRKLPELTPEQYETLLKNAPKHEELMKEMDMGHDHEHGGEHQ